MEERISVQPPRPHATSQPSRFSHTNSLTASLPVDPHDLTCAMCTASALVQCDVVRPSRTESTWFIHRRSPPCILGGPSSVLQRHAWPVFENDHDFNP